MSSLPPGQRRKVAILGGGVGSMVAAFELTQEPHWQDKYEITVYQLGWRLGGKGASGRELGQGERILEHGLHVWGGYYDNAFRVMRDCYDALQRPHSVPIRSVEQAFLGVNQVYLSDFVDDHPHFWRVDFPPNDARPGIGGVYLSPRDYLVELIEGLRSAAQRVWRACSPRCPGNLRRCWATCSPRTWSRTCMSRMRSPGPCRARARAAPRTACCIGCCMNFSNTLRNRPARRR
jgi:uncharacterized protein with NAD-binding domain and iron-sulfur cluster